MHRKHEYVCVSMYAHILIHKIYELMYVNKYVQVHMFVYTVKINELIQAGSLFF